MDYGPVLQSYFSVSWKSFSLEVPQNVLLNVQETLVSGKAKKYFSQLPLCYQEH